MTSTSLRPVRGPCLIASVLLLLGGLFSSVRAQEAGDTPPGADESSAPRVIFVPLEKLKDLLPGDVAQTGIVPYAEYLEFLAHRAQQAIEQLPVKAVITSADYTATIEEDVARVQATYTLQVLGDPWVELPLSFGDSAVGELTTDSEKLLLRGTGDGSYALLLGEKGEQTLTLELLTKVRTSPDGREFSLNIPAVGVTNLKLTIPEADQTVEINPRLINLPAEGRSSRREHRRSRKPWGDHFHSGQLAPQVKHQAGDGPADERHQPATGHDRGRVDPP
ncbi:MAG: hypothetical protein R3B90_16445 [Planctomycetaceae bacterium]